jgi:hypothetical protein
VGDSWDQKYDGLSSCYKLCSISKQKQAFIYEDVFVFVQDWLKRMGDTHDQYKSANKGGANQKAHYELSTLSGADIKERVRHFAGPVHQQQYYFCWKGPQRATQ